MHIGAKAFGGLVPSGFTFSARSKVKKRLPLKDLEGGYSGVEAILVATLLSLLVGAILMPLVTGQFYWHRGESDAEVRREARLAINGMVRDVRHAGYKSTGFDFLKDGKADDITFEADLDDDGSAEVVRYFKDGEILKKSVLKPGDLVATESQVSDHVKSFHLTYFDTADQEKSLTDGALSAENRLKVVLIQVALETSITRAGYTREIALTSEARIRR
jgi:hypothetical protein